MNKVLLSIAGFNIQLIFKGSKINSPFRFKEKLKNDILDYCDKFIVREKINKADFSIELVYEFDPEILSIKPKRKFYSILYKEVSKNLISTYSHIGLFQFQRILMHALYTLLINNNGVLLHASAININGKANIFLGSSGSGKSTVLSLLSKNYMPLADDTVAMRKDKNIYYFYPTPFLERELWVKKVIDRYALGKIFFLRKSSSFEMERINNKELVLKRIATQIFAQEEEDFKRQKKAIFDFVSEHNGFYFLYFERSQKGMLKLFGNYNEVPD